MAADSVKRAVTFVDGQNLYHAAKSAFGYSYPNYDVVALSKAVCEQQSWKLQEVRFYSGIPEPADDPFWSKFWQGKLPSIGRQAHVFTRPLRYRYKRVRLADGTSHRILVGEEKGIDVRIALDVVSLAFRREYDVAVIFSQDQDLSEAADDVRQIARDQKRWIKLASAFPVNSASRNRRGIDKTDWIPIDRQVYDSCLDARDYRDKTIRNRQ